MGGKRKLSFEKDWETIEYYANGGDRRFEQKIAPSGLKLDLSGFGKSIQTDTVKTDTPIQSTDTVEKRIVSLFEQGVSYRNIADTVSVSLGKVQRTIKKMEGK
jgi:hypothetical protein